MKIGELHLNENIDVLNSEIRFTEEFKKEFLKNEMCFEGFNIDDIFNDFIVVFKRIYQVRELKQKILNSYRYFCCCFISIFGSIIKEDSNFCIKSCKFT